MDYKTRQDIFAKISSELTDWKYVSVVAELTSGSEAPAWDDDDLDRDDQVAAQDDYDYHQEHYVRDRLSSSYCVYDDVYELEPLYTNCSDSIENILDEIDDAVRSMIPHIINAAVREGIVHRNHNGFIEVK